MSLILSLIGVKMPVNVNYISLLRDLSGKKMKERGVVLQQVLQLISVTICCVFWPKYLLNYRSAYLMCPMCSNHFILKCSFLNMSLLFVYRRARAASSNLSPYQSSDCVKKGSCMSLCRTSVNGGRRKRPRG